jgi:outer membrane protein OmpA-like peptidoglycan-associated protein
MTKTRFALPFYAAVVLAGSALLPSTAVSQDRGTIEAGIFGRYTLMDDVLSVEDMIAGGGRLGLFLWRNVSIEGDFSYGVASIENPVPPDDEYSSPLWNFRLLWNAPFGQRNAFLLGGGYAYDAFGYARSKPQRSGGPSGLVGVRFGFGDSWSLRGELHGHMGASVDADTELQRPDQDSYFNYGFQLGLSYQFNPFRTKEVVREVPKEVVRVQVDTVYRERIVEQPATAPAAGGTVVIGIVNFVFAKADLTSDANRILSDIAASLARPENRNIRIEVKGHTDAVGGEQANQQLADRRANAVADYLAANGVDRGRITTVAAGKGEPVAENRTPEGRATNRRVVISIVR